jgi:hypothetical protein
MRILGLQHRWVTAFSSLSKKARVLRRWGLEKRKYLVGKVGFKLDKASAFVVPQTFPHFSLLQA